MHCFCAAVHDAYRDTVKRQEDMDREIEPRRCVSGGEAYGSFSKTKRQGT